MTRSLEYVYQCPIRMFTFNGWLAFWHRTSFSVPLFTFNCIFSPFEKTFGIGVTYSGKLNGIVIMNCPSLYDNFCDQQALRWISDPPLTLREDKRKNKIVISIKVKLNSQKQLYGKQMDAWITSGIVHEKYWGFMKPPSSLFKSFSTLRSSSVWMTWVEQDFLSTSSSTPRMEPCQPDMLNLRSCLNILHLTYDHKAPTLHANLKRLQESYSKENRKWQYNSRIPQLPTSTKVLCSIPISSLKMQSKIVAEQKLKVISKKYKEKGKEKPEHSHSSDSYQFKGTMIKFTNLTH